jgi:hypothetical protein
MISALERLRKLRVGKDHEQADLVVGYGLPTGAGRQAEGHHIRPRVRPLPGSPTDLPMDWRIDWEERAAILEYDGGLSRKEADRRAFNEILGRDGSGR